MAELTTDAVLRRFRRAKARRRAWEAQWQFSCWNPDDPNRDKLLAVGPGDPRFDACRRIARRAVSGVLDDPTGGATHYHARGVDAAWAEGRKPCAVIGDHLFYNDVEG